MEGWTQAKMRDLAEQERANLGLAAFEPLDLHRLAHEYGGPIHSLADLADEKARDAVAYFSQDASHRWSAALIAVGSSRVIIENDTHAPVRRRSSIVHELRHHLLEHPFEEIESPSLEPLWNLFEPSPAGPSRLARATRLRPPTMAVTKGLA